jgi:hypothetical protein
MFMIYSPEEAREKIDWKQHVAIIGSGKGHQMYKFNEEKVSVFCINHSINSYHRTDKTFSLMVQGHFDLMAPQIPVDQKIFLIYRNSVRNMKLADGSTLTLFLSYLVKFVPDIVKNIYLQGFSFDGPREIYNWPRQLKGVEATHNYIKEKNLDINITMTTISKRLRLFDVALPEEKGIILI